MEVLVKGNHASDECSAMDCPGFCWFDPVTRCIDDRD